MFKKLLSGALAITLFLSCDASLFTETAAASGANTPAYIENEVIIILDDDTSNKKAEQITDGTVTTLDAQNNIALIQYEDNINEVKMADELSEKPQIKSAQPNYIYTTDTDGSLTDDTYGDKQWNFDYMDVPEAWNLIDRLKPQQSRTAEDKIKVATLDTGINTDHYDLQANIDKENCVTVADSEEPYEQYEQATWSHGTATAGIIAATSNNGKGCSGIAAGNNNDLIDLMAINVFRDDNYTGQRGATTADVINGIDYACSHGVRVINMCLGHSPDMEDSTGAPHDDVALKEAVDNAVDTNDVIFICSAGNHNNTDPWYPSDFDSVISVINTKQYDKIDSLCKNSSSNYGSTKDISAPGTSIYTTKLRGTCSTSSGTSAAAPMVTGVVALMLCVDPSLTSDQIKEKLYSTATDLYTPGYDIYTGHGNVNAYSAVAAAAGIDDHIKAKPFTCTTVAAVSSGKSSVKISWKKLARASKYAIYRSTSKNGTYKKVKTILDSSAAKWEDTGLKFNKYYYYKIKTYGTSDDGKRTKSALCAAAAARPRTVVPSYYTKSADYKTNIVRWKKSKDASGYKIYRSTSKNRKYKAVKTVKNPSTGIWKDKNRIPGKTYYYKMKAYVSKSGHRYYSKYSEIKSQKAKPAKPSITLSKKSRTIKVTVNKVPKVTGYYVYRKDSMANTWKKVKTLGAVKTTWRNKNLSKTIKYSYRVQAFKIVKGKEICSFLSTIKSQLL